MPNLIQPKKPPFLFTYWNPFSENSNLIENWFDYVKNVSLAKYAADSVGRYIQETSADQIRAIDATGEKICGQLYSGFSALEKQLGLISDELGEISNTLQSIDSRLGLLMDEVKTSNLLLENVAELLRIPDSQKQRQHHIEMGLKFLKNALKDEEFYQDALTELLDAEKLMPSDYFVLHRIGIIYFFVPALGNLEKAAEYFSRAGKYAAVESDPNAARLSNILNKRVNKKFDNQNDSSSGEIAQMAAESYFQAGAVFYALGRFEEAAKVTERAVKQQPEEAKHRFFLAKYLTRTNKSEEGIPHLQKAIELVPEMALAAVGDFDLNKLQPILDLLNHLDLEVSKRLRESIKTLKDWPQNSYQYAEVQQLITDSQELLEKGNYSKKVLVLTKAKQWELRLPLIIPFIEQLNEIAAFGISFNDIEAAQLLHQNNTKNVKKVWAEKIFKGFCIFQQLQVISVKTTPTFNERILLETANGQFIPYKDKDLIKNCITGFFNKKAIDAMIESDIRFDGFGGGYNVAHLRILKKKKINLDSLVCILSHILENLSPYELRKQQIAEKVMEELENHGVIERSNGDDPRDILIDLDNPNADDLK